MSDQQESSGSDFELMDREDEEQILAELRGVPVEKFIYLNKQTGKHELTYAGTKWVVRQMAELGEAIRIDGHPKVERCMIDPEWITCTVLGRRVKINIESRAETVLDTNIGASRGWIKQRTTSKGIIPDEFFFNKTCSKAVRNLQNSLIPTELLNKMRDTLVSMQAKGGGQGSQVQGRPPAQQGRPAPGAAAPAEKQKGTTAPAAEQTSKPAPAGTAAPAASAPAKQTTKPATPKQTATPSSVPIETVQQGFRAVFVAFAKTEDKTTLQKILKALTGKTAITDLERELMVELGPLLRRAINGQVKWNGTALHEISSGEQLWPKVEAQAEPAPDPQHEEAPQPQAEPPMF